MAGSGLVPGAIKGVDAGNGFSAGTGLVGRAPLRSEEVELEADKTGVGVRRGAGCSEVGKALGPGKNENPWPDADGRGNCDGALRLLIEAERDGVRLVKLVPDKSISVGWRQQEGDVWFGTVSTAVQPK